MFSVVFLQFCPAASNGHGVRAKAIHHYKTFKKHFTMGVFRIRLGAVVYGCVPELVAWLRHQGYCKLNGENNIVKFAPQGELMAA